MGIVTNFFIMNNGKNIPYWDEDGVMIASHYGPFNPAPLKIDKGWKDGIHFTVSADGKTLLCESPRESWWAKYDLT